VSIRKTAETDTPILPWRFVAGVFLHCAVPLYLAALIVDFALLPSQPVSVADVLRHILRITPFLLGGYLVFGISGSLLAAIIDPLLRVRRRRQAAKDPLIAAMGWERMILDTLRQGKGRFGIVADAALTRLEAARWDHGDPLQQALARDLIETIRAAHAALSSAPPERRQALADMTADTLERIAAGHDEIAAARARHDEAQVQMISRYIENRYGPSDFAGEGD
jgi:hypothetical protein